MIPSPGPGAQGVLYEEKGKGERIVGLLSGEGMTGVGCCVGTAGF